VSGLGAGKVLGYLEAAGEVESRWGFALAQELGRVDLGPVLEQAAARGTRFIVSGDAEWPTQLGVLLNGGALHERGGEPVGLWVRGAHDLRQLAGSFVAFVGSRAATTYGAEQATELSRDLGTLAPTVISGLAYGVDQAAHRGALIAGGPTIAVLPGGVAGPTWPHPPSCLRRSLNAGAGPT
jgi:DNA processing protein